jgi:ATP-dependent exoDNAse (exonuclease V) beta subunit
MVMETFERDILPLMPELSEKKEKLETCFYKLKKDGTKSLNHEKCEKRVAELESIVKPFLKKTGVLDFFEAAEMAGCILTKMACYIGRSLYLPRMMEDGVFDFDAIVFLVISLIKSKGRTWTLERMKNEGMEMKNLYIDEAQDSDIVQNYLISVLAGGDDKTLNVTVVGDIKQSIYQWRNAYPEEFRAMYDEASGLKRSETLKKSWRVKNGENLEFINKMFERMNTASGGKWDYDPARDELEPNDGRIVNGIKKKIKITRMFKDTDIKSIKSDMEAFIESGSCGILVEKKRFATQSGIMDSITGIKQRIKIENNGKDGILGTSLAERMLITSLLYSRLNDKLQFMPYLLLFTTPGNFIRAKSRQVKGATDMIDMFKKVKRYTESAYDAYRESAIAKSAYLLMNKYGLWKYMFHGDVNGPDKISLESVRRGINTMLAAMHLGEKTGDTALYSREDVVAQSLESDTSPFEWYGLPGSKAQAGDKELTTIHSSKGLEYENIIIFADIMERLKPETDFSNKEYSFLYSADFDSILTDRPEVGVRFFPYFGSTTCKVIKNYYAEADAPWKNGLDYYDKTSRKVISENLNVLYVAFTRAKDGIWIIDAPGKSRYIKEPKVDEMARELEVISGAEPVNINLPQKTAQSAVTGEVFYYELAEKVPLLEVKEDEAETSVRQIIKETVKIKFGGNCAGPYEGFDHIEIGTMAHEMVQSVLSKINDITQYQGEASGIKTNDAHEKAACEIVSSAGTIGELQKLKYIIKDKKDLRSEVPIWGIGDKGMLVKGVIDSLALTDDKVSIIEYKTVFDDGKAQKQMSKKQLELYEGMIKGLAGKRGVEKISVMLKGR